MRGSGSRGQLAPLQSKTKRISKLPLVALGACILVLVVLVALVPSASKPTSHQSLSLNQLVSEPSHPKIFVYELPHQFNHQIAARKPWCEQEAFGTEILLHEQMLASPHRTLDPEEASLFFVPVYSACIVYKNFGNFQAYRYIVKKALRHVRVTWPYWNRTQGKDHVWAFVHDYGACLSWHDQVVQTKAETLVTADKSVGTGGQVFFDELRNSIIISHLGDLSVPCFSTHRDIVIPPLCSDPRIYRQGQGGAQVARESRDILIHFRGTVSWYHQFSIPSLGVKKGFDRMYSRGVRQKIYELYARDPVFFIQEGSSQDYVKELERSVFCLCPTGYATWSRRLFDSVMMGCIPVIIADNIELPFEKFLDYRKFSVKVLEKDVPNLKKILTSIPPATIRSKQDEMLKVWKAFAWNRPSQAGDAFNLTMISLLSKASVRKPVGPAHFT
jgi:hypothetical protein